MHNGNRKKGNALSHARWLQQWLARVALGAAVLISATAAAQQAPRAVTQANFNVSAGYAESDDFQAETLGLEANLPLGRYLGIGAGVRRHWERLDQSSGDDADVLDGELGLFARDPGRGVIGVEYGRTEISPEAGEDRTARTYRGVMALYDQAFDLVLSRAEMDFSGGDGETLHTARTELAGYGGSNLRISAEYGFLDVADDLRVTITYQPAFTGNVLALEAGYADTDALGEVYSGRLVYYFGDPLPLLVRFRQQLLP